jgi:DNA-binding transcriptional LysR family regulator
MVDLDPRLLRTLIAVHREGSVTAAAEEIGYTPSAVSQHLARLESEVGVPLTRRVGRNIEFTAAGLALVAETPDVLAAIDRARGAAVEAGGSVSGSVGLGTIQSAAVALVPRALRDLEERHPDVTVELFVQNTDTSLRDLEAAKLDIVIDQDYADAPRPPRPQTTRHHVMRDEIVVAAPEDMPPPRTVDDLREARWILPHPDTNICGRVMIERCHGAGFEPTTPIWASDYLLGLELAAAGFGVAMVSAIVAPTPPPGLRYHHLDPPVMRTLTALTRMRTQRAAVQALVESLQTAGAEIEAAAG